MIGPIIRIALKVLTAVFALLTVLAAYGGYIPPKVWALPSVFALAYPYLAILLTLAGLAWLIGRRFIMAIFCGVALLAGAPSLSANLPVSITSEARTGEKTFTLLSFNIMHGRDVRHPELTHSRTMSYILHSGADIVCVQELLSFSADEIPNLSPALADSIKRAFPYRVVDGNSDQAIFSRFPVELRQQGRVEGATHYIFEEYSADVYGRKVAIINVHLEPYHLTEKQREVMSDIRGVRSAKRSVAELKGSILSKLKSSFRQRAKDAALVRQAIDRAPETLIVCGDFNDVPASWAYRTILGEDMRDAYTDTGLGMMVTYNLHGFYFHIDQIFYRGNLRPLSVEKGKTDSSDHFPIRARFALTAPPGS